MVTSIDAALTVVTATALEARAARRELRGVRVVEAGIGLARTARDGFGDVVVSCGLAGGLRPDLSTGAILIPGEVGCPDGTVMTCAPSLVAALRDGARLLGLDPVEAPLLTSATLVRGGTLRTQLAERGYAGVDMESGLIRAANVAAVRVILDTPHREISEFWLRPATALLHPRAWRELPWLARHAPRCARLAARVIRVLLERTPKAS